MTEPTLHYTDAEIIKRLTAWHESEKAEITTLRAEVARLNALVITADPAEAVTVSRSLLLDLEAKMKAQAAQIESLKAALTEISELHHDRAYHSGTYEACKFITCAVAKDEVAK